MVLCGASCPEVGSVVARRWVAEECNGSGHGGGCLGGCVARDMWGGSGRVGRDSEEVSGSGSGSGIGRGGSGSGS